MATIAVIYDTLSGHTEKMARVVAEGVLRIEGVSVAHYGAVAVGDPGENELAACRILGERTARYVKQMSGR